MSKKTRDRDLAGTTSFATEAWADRSTVVGLFDHQTQAEAAINALKAAGFPERDIGVAMRDRNSQGELAEETGTQAAEGAAGGAVGGGVVGGVIGLLGGLGALVIPGLGPIFAAGWLGSTLAGAGIGAAAGGIIGGLVGLGVPENEARHFEEGIREGRVLVTVKAEDRAAEAAEILRRHAADLGPAFGTVSGSSDLRPARSTGNAGDAGQERLELREEEFEVGKERVQPGDADVRDRGERERTGRYGGDERRRWRDPAYAGPERRLAVR